MIAAKSHRRSNRHKKADSTTRAKPAAHSLYDRIKHLCGVISGPGDLSTNPKYMEGYGQSRRP